MFNSICFANSNEHVIIKRDDSNLPRYVVIMQTVMSFEEHVEIMQKMYIKKNMIRLYIYMEVYNMKIFVGIGALLLAISGTIGIHLVKNINYKGYYAATRTFANIDVLNILKGEETMFDDSHSIEVAFYGGVLPYSEFEKSLTESEKEKNATLELFNPEGIKKSNVYVKTMAKDQLDIVEDKTYLLYLRYSTSYDAYVPISAEYGVKEYDIALKQVKNHITGEVNALDEL